MSKPGVLFAVVAWLLVVLATFDAHAAYVPPPIAGHVTDAAGKLTPAEVATLNQKLSDYRRCSTNHVAVFLPASLEGASVEDVAYAAFNTWKIGEAGKDNGVLLVLATAERKIRIETGKGIGDRLTDLESAEILREVVGPNLEEGKVFAAADQATTRIGAALGGCIMAAPTTEALEGGLFSGRYLVLRIVLTSVVAFLAIVTVLANRVRLFVGLPIVLALAAFLFWWTSGRNVDGVMNRFFPFLFLSPFAAIGSLVWRQVKNAPRGRGGSSGSSSWSSDSGSSGGSDYSSSSSSSDYSGGGGSSGGGGASDSY